MATLYGIWHVSESGKLTLCESDESQSVYYDCAFAEEADAIAYAAKLSENNCRLGLVSCYLAKALPEGCKSTWVES